MPLLDKLPGRFQLSTAWAIAAALLLLLGWLRQYTEAEYAFASAIIVPVFLVAWCGGVVHGLIASALAAGMWIAGDVLSEREFASAWTPYVNGVVRLATYCFIAYLAGRIRELLDREAEMATQDSLTGLLNQRAFYEAGQAEAQRASRYAHPMSVARLGGDEFAVLLHEIDEKSAVQAARKISESVEAALEPYPPVSASIGVAWYEQPKGDFKPMLKAADAEMYEVKHGGKGKVRVRKFAHKIKGGSDAARGGAGAKSA